MAFGITRRELTGWKDEVRQGNVAILTHYWQDERFPGCTTVTKVGCCDAAKLQEWGKQYGLKREWIHYSTIPHFDLFGHKQKKILLQAKKNENLPCFGL